jgi:hypothetical protein
MNARRLVAAAAREISVFLLFTAWAVVVTRPLAFRLTTHTLPGPDPLSHLWMVSWLTGHAFQPSQIFHGNIFSPAPHAALMTDLSLGTAVLVLPLRLFTTEPLVLFNLATSSRWPSGAGRSTPSSSASPAIDGRASSADSWPRSPPSSSRTSST